jgi:cation:H+ antiporter
VLGVCALVRPIVVDSRSLRFDGAMVVVTILLFALLSVAAPLSRPIGGAYLLLLALYIGWSIRIERGKPTDHTAPFERGEAAAELVPTEGPGGLAGVLLTGSQVLGGILMVVFGAHWLVGAAVDLARSLSVSESVIGLTVVAIGTTLPELVTSVVAARRKNTDVALGNVFGSCIYNILGIAGVTALIAPTRVPDTIAYFGNPIMVVVSIVMLALAWTGLRVSQREGAIMLVLYTIYVLATWQA